MSQLVSAIPECWAYIPPGQRTQFDADVAAVSSSDRAAAGAAQFGRPGLTDSVLQDIAVSCRVSNSFAGGTLVALADGTFAPIADVQVGDQVLAYDFDTGTTVTREVTATLPHTDWLLEAHLSDGSVMSVTEDHRFWSITDDDWVELQDLDSTDQLLTPDGATVTVDWLDWDAGVTAPAFDLTVDQEHNFFVTADTTAEPVLVHNQTPGLFCGVEVRANQAAKFLAVDVALDDASRAALTALLVELPPEV